MATESNVLHIIHFNDVYNINPIIKKDENGKIRKIIGGAARFQTFINTLKPLKPIILFSGDFLSPSDISTVTKGEHMIPIMNGFGITCSVIGNHELDFGNEHCVKMLAKLNYPVLNTNILTPVDGVATGDVNLDSKLKLAPLGGCIKSYIHKHNDNFNVGMLGISENWSRTLPIKGENGYVYLDFIEECQKRVDEMRKENKIDLMVVLTHSRLLNDQLLASKIRDVDLILGGHDHMYYVGMNDDTKTMIVKSGTDFKNVSWLQVQLNKDAEDIKELDTGSDAKKIEQDLSKVLNEQKGPYKGTKYTFLNRYYDINMHVAAHEETEKLVHDLSDAFHKQAEQTIGYIAAPIDCRFSTVRAGEGTAGNLITDVIRRAYHCDCVLINGGALRADRILDAGKFTYRNILEIVPFPEPVIVMKMKGSSIVKMIEHGLSGLPKAEGRFPQVSGLRFLYDPKEPIGKRVKKVWIERYPEDGATSYYQSMSSLKSPSPPKKTKSPKSTEDDAKEAADSENEDANAFDDGYGGDLFEIIQEDEVYTVATREYLASGGDGYTVFEEALETLVDEDAGIPPNMILRNFFWAIDSVNRLLKMSDDAEKQKEAKKRTRRFSLEAGGRRGSLIAMEKSLPKQADGLQDVDEKEQTEEATVEKYVDQIQVKPMIEHRCMTVDEEVDLESIEMVPMQHFFRRLPSFVGMEHLPRQQSLVKILDEIEQQDK